MKLFNVEKRKFYSIDWRKELKKHFMEKLSSMYLQTLSNAIVDDVLNNIQIPYFYGDFVIVSKNQYYSFDAAKLIKLASVNDILPKSNIANNFLQGIFTSKNWQACLYSEEIETLTLPILEISKESSEIWSKNKKVEDLDSFLSKYFCKDIKENIKKDLDALISSPTDAVAHFVFQNFHYFLCKNANGLKLKQSLISPEKLEKILHKHFNGIILAKTENIVSFISNKLIYGQELSYPITLTDFVADQYPIKGTFYLGKEKYDCFIDGSSSPWLTLIPLSFIEDMLNLKWHKKREEIEYQFSCYPRFFSRIKTIFEPDTNHMPSIFLLDSLPPFKGAYIYNNTWQAYKWTGKDTELIENINDDELSKCLVLVEVNELPEIREQEEEEKQKQEMYTPRRERR